MHQADQPKRVVLVVEDEWLIRDEIVEEIRRAGLLVLEAETAEAALELLKAEVRIDVLITDINFPGSLTGWDVAEECRARQAAIPIIYASGSLAAAGGLHRSMGFQPESAADTAGARCAMRA